MHLPETCLSDTSIVCLDLQGLYIESEGEQGSLQWLQYPHLSDTLYGKQVIGEPLLEPSLETVAKFVLTILFHPGLLGLAEVEETALSRMTALVQVGLNPPITLSCWC